MRKIKFPEIPGTFEIFLICWVGSYAWFFTGEFFARDQLHMEYIATMKALLHPAEVPVAAHIHHLYIITHKIAVIVPVVLIISNMLFVFDPKYDIRDNPKRFAYDFLFWLMLYVPLIVAFFKW